MSNLGFREAEIRVALYRLQREPALAQASFDALLRAALAVLRSPRARAAEPRAKA